MRSERPRFTTNLGSEFILVEPGIFVMGSDSPDANPSETPSRTVTIQEPYFFAVRPVTQIEWFTIMGRNPSKFTDGIESGLRPVESVTWMDAMDFADRLNSEVGEKFLGLSGKFRLPSEAEWEYAVRAGTDSHWSFNGSDRDLSEHGWHAGNSGAKTQVVGQKLPNPWGFHDVHGLISEWCLDAWHQNFVGAPTNQTPWLDEGESDYRVHKGGCWYHESHSCRSSSRGKMKSTGKSDGLGLRLVWEPLEN